MNEAGRPGRRWLAITIGDPRGIGPEVAAAAMRELSSLAERPHFLLVGPSGTGAEAMADRFLETGGWEAGSAPSLAGRLAGRAIEEAARLALTGEVAGLVTGPIDKAALYAGGYDFPGHTEMLAALSGAVDVSMLMSAEMTSCGHPLRVVLATTHLPLADVPARFTADLLVRQTRMVHRALREGWSIDRPRIALCAFNPHASDGGRFGSEEATVYAPAMARLADEGIQTRGPFPADTVFLRAARGEFDVVVAPYHDVGMAAFKTAAFGQGVNVTLGLPFVRTSPDHGTALDIAGRGMADAHSMIEAILLANRLAGRPREPAYQG
jgi:4-hydroxythreonine-4-phosphate dehydrogenase